jgi:hypothetical protein
MKKEGEREEQHVEGIISYSKSQRSAAFQLEIMNPNNELTYYMSLREKRNKKVEEGTDGGKE